MGGRLTGAERGRVLRRAAELLRERTDDLARLESFDAGRPIQETPSADVVEYFGGIAAGVTGEYTDLGRAFVYTRREPLGVCAGIGAWNYPLQIACWKAAPALAGGNALVFKPAALAPLSALVLAEVLTEAGPPPGLFNVLTGVTDTGQALSRHPGIAKVSLTGGAALSVPAPPAASWPGGSPRIPIPKCCCWRSAAGRPGGTGASTCRRRFPIP